MKKYFELEMKVVNFEKEDVIRTSFIIVGPGGDVGSDGTDGCAFGSLFGNGSTF